MTVRARYKLFGVIGCLVTLFAQAQTPVHSPYVLTTYDIAELASRPGPLIVGTTMLTIVEFDAQIDNVASGRQELLSIEVQDNLILLRANQSVGQTDLAVRAGGRTVLFTIQLDSTMAHPRRYVVAERRAAPPRASGSMGLGGVVAGDRADHTSELPEWLNFFAEAAYAPSGTLAIHYGVANQSDYPVAVDAGRLRLHYSDPVAGMIRLPYSLSRVSAEGLVNRVAPGGSEFGVIVVTDPPAIGGRITLEWTLVQIGPGETVVVEKVFDDFGTFLRGSGR
jgi:hypothetical protein